MRFLPSFRAVVLAFLGCLSMSLDLWVKGKGPTRGGRSTRVALAARPLRASGVRLAMSPTSRNAKIHYFTVPSIGNLHEFVTRFKVTFCVKLCDKN